MKQAKKITRKQYLMALGLEQLAKEYHKRLQHIEEEMASIFGQEEDPFGTYGHISDAMAEDDMVDYILRKLNIKKPLELDK